MYVLLDDQDASCFHVDTQQNRYSYIDTITLHLILRVLDLSWNANFVIRTGYNTRYIPGTTHCCTAFRTKTAHTRPTSSAFWGTDYLNFVCDKHKLQF